MKVFRSIGRRYQTAVSVRNLVGAVVTTIQQKSFCVFAKITSLAEIDGTTSEQYCGYPGFGLDCSNSSQDPVLNILKDSYFVHQIDYKDYTLDLIDIDIIDVKCPRVRNNFTVETLPMYQTSSDLNLTFYFNCSAPPPPALPASPIDCLETESSRSYVVEVILTEPRQFDRWYEFCEDKVDVAVKNSERTNFGLISELRSALNEGFSLNWKTLSNCGTCEASGGRCGYNNSAQEFLCFCQDNTTTKNQSCRGLSGEENGQETYPPGNNPETNPPGKHQNLGLKFAAASGVVGCSILLLVVLIICRRRMRTKYSSSYHKDIEAFISQYGSSIPRRFRYSMLKKITNSFKDELGKGGFGNVYRGHLADGRVVAVKVLKETKGNGEEFINEVASIGRTSHVNVVALLGFCYDGKRRALIYEFMPNGSLEKFIYGKTPSLEGQHLGWEKLYSIAIGIARGLEYLHRGCNTRILHFDIKPHNILLDENFRPKISDFGLAKLYSTDESIISSLLQARGTIGYIAPEVTSRNFGQVSHKSDVYSYGMMILEMVGGRKNVNAGADHTSEIYYPRWLYKRIQSDDMLNLANGISSEENEIVRKMVIVGLWCIQIYPSERPSISKVIEMLEGQAAALEIPPRPYLCSVPSSPSDSQKKLVLSSSSGTEPTSSA